MLRDMNYNFAEIIKEICVTVAATFLSANLLLFNIIDKKTDPLQMQHSSAMQQYHRR